MENPKYGLNFETKIAVIICYFGEWPTWINFFVHTCRRNEHIDFLIFSDCKKLPHLNAPNVIFHDFSLARFNKLATERLDLPINITSAYKLCDFKPAYGAIFDQYISNYDFWGHGDLDIILGNVRVFITQRILMNYDIITTRKEYLAGHFTLYRNSPNIKCLYMASKDYKIVFTTPDQNFCFDECNFLWHPLLKGFPLNELQSEIVSMTHIVKELAREGHIKAYFDTHVIEQDTIDDELNLIAFDNEVTWENGRLSSVNDNIEYMYFHFHLLKRNQDFIIPDWIEMPNTFFASQYGFSLTRNSATI